MPINRENRSRYPSDWKAISLRLREQAEWRCQWCDRSDRRLVGPSGCVLTVAHLNHLPEDCRRDNLAVLCERCHLGYDMRGHVINRRNNRAKREREVGAAAGQLLLF